MPFHVMNTVFSFQFQFDNRLIFLGLTWECAEAQDAFVHCDGLLRVLQSSIDKLKIKASFLLVCLCNENPTFKGLFTRFLLLLLRN
jgi:hypothetical protein